MIFPHISELDGVSLCWTETINCSEKLHSEAPTFPVVNLYATGKIAFLFPIIRNYNWKLR